VSEDWVCVHVASNRGEAELLAGILREEGIAVQIRGTDITAQGPFFPEIMVPGNQATQAYSLLDGASKAAIPAAGSPEPPTKRGARYMWFLGGAAAGVVVTLFLSTRSGPARPNGTYTHDTNGDGKIDTWEHYARGVFKHGEYDRNHDGKVDERTRRQGDKFMTARDLNHDGKEDAWEICDENACGDARYDLDYDGKPDEWTFREKGQVVERRWSLMRDGVVDKKAFYRFGIKTEEHFDLDRDGVFEMKKEYDAFEQEKRAAP